MADLQLRTLEPHELTDVLRLDALVWGNEPDEERDRCYLQYLEPDRVVGAFDGADLIGTGAIVSLRLTVPGGAEIPLAGATWLLLHPLYRMGGLGRRVDAAVRSGVRPDEPVFGGMLHDPWIWAGDQFGPASRYAEVELLLDRRRPPGSGSDCELEYVPQQTAIDAVRAVAGRLRGARNGWVQRKPCTEPYKYSRWDRGIDAYGPVNFVVHRDPAGEVDGFLSYRLNADSSTQSRPEGTIAVIELLAASPEVETVLWQHCTNNRLAYRILALRRPVDDPLVWRLADPRDLRQTVRDDLTLTVVDVPAALAARRYAREDTLVIEVTGAGAGQRPGAAQRVRLTGGLDGAVCTPASAGPDLVMTGRALAAAYLGDTSLVTLAAAGQVSEHTPGSLRRASAMFSWSPAPWLQDIF